MKEIFNAIFPAEYPGYIKNSKKLNLFCVNVKSGGVGDPVIPTILCFVWKDGYHAAKP